MDRAIPVKLPTLDRLQADLAYARRMETRAKLRYRDQENRPEPSGRAARYRRQAAHATLYRRYSNWRDKRQAIEGQIEQRIARDAEVQRIFDAAGATR